jgi:hypothetical protein
MLHNDRPKVETEDVSSCKIITMLIKQPRDSDSKSSCKIIAMLIKQPQDSDSKWHLVGISHFVATTPKQARNVISFSSEDS